eukprot:TRINITY_DN1265_c0_g1_i1.p1 TRINITY_DN1265_c0_g1~~TRINITY_DN1265_c0_g1_i1.p1  ORF type:complete len:176 (-),score=46.27 TRINITY_DN1265_c0_g1_i1:241-744(-)
MYLLQERLGEATNHFDKAKNLLDAFRDQVPDYQRSRKLLEKISEEAEGKYRFQREFELAQQAEEEEEFEVAKQKYSSLLKELIAREEQVTIAEAQQLRSRKPKHKSKLLQAEAEEDELSTNDKTFFRQLFFRNCQKFRTIILSHRRLCRVRKVIFGISSFVRKSDEN